MASATLLPETIEICRVCGHATCYLGQKPLLSHQVSYFECPNCGYVQTETPHWLGEAYAEPVNLSDTGLLVRNWTQAQVVLATLALLGQRRGGVVDYAGGYGVLVRLLRDRGIDAYWLDAYSDNLIARGFAYRTTDPGTMALVTAFEAFEHFVYPSDELGAMLAIAPNLLLSTELVPQPTPARWWYYGPEHGQHIGFFRLETLRYLARRHGKYLASDGHSFHLFTQRPMAPGLFQLVLKTKKAVSLVAGLGLKSKTWDDYLLLSGQHAHRL
jgi:predicted RNA-binding Zn-ribbon protein involved in translation (DUF1610 family)